MMIIEQGGWVLACVFAQVFIVCTATASSMHVYGGAAPKCEFERVLQSLDIS
jgi:hypothetical protein